MNVFILGHTGFFGKNIFKLLKTKKELNIIGISSDKIDLTQKNSFKILQKIVLPNSIIVMCIGIKKQLGDHIENFEKNTEIINNFIRSISKITPKKIIYFSSASVYGEDTFFNGKISEITPVRLKSYYGISKYMAECLLTKECFDSKTKLIILRPPLVYGKDDLSRGYGPTDFAYKALTNEKINLWGDGSEFREFIYIEDLANIVEKLIYVDFNGVLNLVSGKSYTFIEIIKLLNERMNINITIELRERSKEKVNHYYSNKLIKNVLGDFMFTDLKNGLSKLCNSINKSK